MRSLREFVVGKSSTSQPDLDFLRSWVSEVSDEHVERISFEFLDHLYLEGHESGAENKLVVAVEKLSPALAKEGKARLPRVRAALKGFKRMAPSQSREPAPQVWASAIAGVLLHKKKGSMALMVMLMFSTYVRPSEAFSIHPSQVLLHPPSGGRPHNFYAVELFLSRSRPFRKREYSMTHCY